MQMTQGTAGSEQRPIKSALLFLVVGVVLLLWAWGSWLYRTLANNGRRTVADSRPVDAAVGPSGSAEVAPVLPWFLMVGLLLVLVFLFGTFAVIRAARRYREVVARRRAGPTSAEDVWAMHKIPRDLDEVD